MEERRKQELLIQQQQQQEFLQQKEDEQHTMTNIHPLMLVDKKKHEMQPSESSVHGKEVIYRYVICFRFISIQYLC